MCEPGLQLCDNFLLTSRDGKRYWMLDNRSLMVLGKSSQIPGEREPVTTERGHGNAPMATERGQDPASGIHSLGHGTKQKGAFSSFFFFGFVYFFSNPAVSDD